MSNTDKQAIEYPCCAECIWKNPLGKLKDRFHNLKTITLNYFRFIIKRYIGPIIVTALALVFFMVFIHKYVNSVDLWNISFVASSSMTFAAFIFTVYNTVKDWHESFSKYMNISFFVGDDIVMRITNVTLAGESDIRSYAQTVGSQAATTAEKAAEGSTVKLLLFPKFNFDSELNRVEEKIKYEVEMHLREKPKVLSDYEKKPEINKACIVWDTSCAPHALPEPLSQELEQISPKEISPLSCKKETA